MAQNVYTAEYYGVRNHITLFVRPSNADSTADGKCFHVTGTILNGMQFEMRTRESPLEAPDHVPNTMILIGTVDDGKMDAFEATCRSIPPPEPQVHLNGKLKDPSKPLRRCGEWIQEAVEKLKRDGILVSHQE